MIKAIKVQLKPNNVQSTRLFQCAGTARWAYNWALGKQMENQKLGLNFLSDQDLRKELTQLKKTEEYAWLNEVSAQIPKQAVKDLCKAYKKFVFTKNKRYSKKTLMKAARTGKQLGTYDLEEHPKFKSKRFSKPSFYHDDWKIKFTETHAQIEKLGLVRLIEHGRIPVDSKYTNPRISHDGLKWWISVGIEVLSPQSLVPISEPIGIDLGVKTLAVVSDGQKFKGKNKGSAIKKSTKKLKRLQRKASRQYEKIKNKEIERKGRNLLKLEQQILKVQQRITNVRTDYLHQVTAELVKTKPEYVVMEDLNIRGMMKNRHLSKSIQNQKLREFRRMMEYKSASANIPVIIADRWFPSSKICSECGHEKEDLKLSDRTYHCNNCGTEIDRDLNAAINLREYGRKELSKVS